jgi:enterochelin esterase-like enzyme
LLFLLGVTSVGCDHRDDPPPGKVRMALPAASNVEPGKLPPEERTWDFRAPGLGRMRVVIALPERKPDERFPVLIAFHGRGETLKGPERGARGWLDDYALWRATDRLAHPPLVPADFQGFVEPPRLEALNRALAEQPYRGLIVACPYVPDMLGGDDPFAVAPPLARFIVDTLVPRLYAETPALGTPASTGIDGVSLGGRAAISVGLLRPQSFGAVASLQAALDPENANDIAERTRQARLKNPTLRLRFLTSNGDYYLRTLSTIHGVLDFAKVPHDFLIVTGPHDYAFNRGPGALEMLAYHDRVLRGHPPP